MQLLKAASGSKPNAIAGAIAGIVEQGETAVIQVIGAGAVNQAVKAIAIARGFVAPQGIDLVCRPAFKVIEAEGEERTAIQLIVNKAKTY